MIFRRQDWVCLVFFFSFVSTFDSYVSGGLVFFSFLFLSLLHDDFFSLPGVIVSLLISLLVPFIFRWSCWFSSHFSSLLTCYIALFLPPDFIYSFICLLKMVRSLLVSPFHRYLLLLSEVVCSPLISPLLPVFLFISFFHTRCGLFSSHFSSFFWVTFILRWGGWLSSQFFSL